MSNKPVLPSLVLLALAGGLCAQEYRGRVQGVVTDGTQAAISGATVTLSNLDTGVASTRLTSEQGRYLFDLVLPGKYSVTVNLQGFNKFVQSNVVLQSRSDVTVDAVLRPGDVRETVTVEGQASTVQFNTSKLETTVDSALVSNLPQISRNPLLLARLDPAVVQSDTAREVEPYMTWSGNRQQVGGGRDYSNDLQIDGSPIGIGYKTSYMPSPDAVQEVAVQQNAVDAEYGHSSGAAITLTMKAGTNDWHGNAFYQGQYPWANALENRVFRTINLGRTHMYGGTVGGPIKKNKLFNFFSYEQWRKTDPNDLIHTLPTDLEREGNFSQSLNATGGLRAIYDPFTTQTSADGRTITRMPLPGNIIPKSAQDPIATLYMSKLWKPNRPGQGPYNINNYYVPLPIRYDYHNISNRTDYVLNEKLRFYGRYSKLWTPVTTSNPTGSDFYVNDRGSQRDALSISGDAVYMVSASTILNVNATYHSFVDASRFASTANVGWNTIWPNSNFYNTIFANKAVPELLPRMSIMGVNNSEYWTAMGPRGGTWDQRPTADSVSVKLARQQGKHYLKMGADTRGTRTTSLIVNNNPGFGFQADATSATYVNPDLRASGDGYATFLLGAVQPAGGGADSWDSGATSMTASILPQGQNRFYGTFINDDWKVSRDLTINLGLRYEFETAYTDPQDRLTRPLDLTSPIPEMQGAAAPQMPAELTQFYKGPTTLNGAFQFADSNNRGQWNAGRGGFSPRIGAAYRINDKSSLRVGYGRYLTPWTGGTFNVFDTIYVGYKNVTGAYPAVLGVPQTRLRDPFPAATPVVPAYEKSLGRYTSLGDSLSYVNANRPRSYSDRINFSFQRQLPRNMLLDVTYYINFSSQLIGSYNINQVDPRVAYEFKDATNRAVANPFFNFSTVNKFPGALRYQRTVGLTSLARQYPQYGNLNVIDGIEGGSSRYQSFQLRLNRRFANGYSVLMGYNYSRQQDEVFFNDIASFTREFTWQESDKPRQRLSLAATWELPVGRGRALFASMPKLLDLAVGGWDLTGLMTWRSGFYVRFGGMQVNGDPIVENPTPARWFNTQAFSRLPNFTPRTNPWQYDGLTNPGLFNVDASIVKRMPITERVRGELRMDVFNAANNMTWANPNTNVQSSLFGVSNNQLSGLFGRRAQLGLRVEF
ncbi:MAG: carboxypeptidase regulatory-like domain-containing protein [Bryobacterales bacterium]|nr:carboxypeptidase regulatory-like domain-containing protein [Bryobacterales bacterium]